MLLHAPGVSQGRVNSRPEGTRPSSFLGPYSLGAKGRVGEQDFLTMWSSAQQSLILAEDTGNPSTC